jgi:hypothetical protein
MRIPYVIDNETSRMADIPSTVLAEHADAHHRIEERPVSEMVAPAEKTGYNLRR